MRLLLCLLLAPLSLLAQEPPEPNYVFRAEFVRVIDGNKIAMNIDLGFGVWVHNQSLTLQDPDKSGLSDEEKEKNMERAGKLRDLFKDSVEIIVQTIRDKDAKPPRYLAVIWVDGTNINEELKKAFP